ncbi:hypothetical protein BS330_34870 [Amycolatopsis keratiniphila subsp. nogabecina]|uniref:GerMN domain-containing protein n=1 Tax=Amycolatopsis keratiniphila subsp. keratiniphila TaxID=227715 RepID=A0A1W2LXU7_9PSEU|nr:hypothetical protein BS330_34870 [Amycolatopsis keratiniphila subsp. nogabecina]ONF71726.1 hypothetical protein AVR91_0211765 [Amycolatopsis keratiniphila subsp. keratiniphila]
MRALVVAVIVLLAAGCGVSPDGPAPAGDAPTGVSPDVTLYFVDHQGQLRPDRRATGRLGSVAEAVSLLLASPAGSGLHSEIEQLTVTSVTAKTGPGVVELILPLAHYEVTRRGIDQIVCTALGVHVQGGGQRTTKVRLRFTVGTEEPAPPRSCPLIK